MKKILIIFSFFISFFSCDKTNENEIKETNKIMYSNLAGEKSQKIVKDTLIKNGIKPENVNSFLEQVKLFNEAVDNKGLIDEFKSIDNLNKIEYDLVYMINKLDEKYPNFAGCNCRITTYTLMNDIIEINRDNIKGKSDYLFADFETIENLPLKLEFDIENFKSFYSDIETVLTKDYSIHLNKILREWENREIKFKNKNVSIISIFFHNELDEPNTLFIGHIGILANYYNKYMFIEKLSPQEPYQAIIFNNKVELNDYLMNKYDISYNQPTASPLILENNNLLETYKLKEKEEGK
ncbi:DUF4300 family protein [Streptobacillus canis]|uniref:DUF4300 family protein n=1 Tax=Streptobacillus canis TaxID=2678686 RepID=UPI0012E2F1B0|nr:DUF4300 family protein [Streptobacillus canis]